MFEYVLMQSKAEKEKKKLAKSMTSQFLSIHRILEGVRAKNFEATIFFVEFHTQRKDGANNTRLQPTKRNRRSHNDAK